MPLKNVHLYPPLLQIYQDFYHRKKYLYCNIDDFLDDNDWSISHAHNFTTWKLSKQISAWRNEQKKSEKTFQTTCITHDDHDHVDVHDNVNADDDAFFSSVLLPCLCATTTLDPRVYIFFLTRKASTIFRKNVPFFTWYPLTLEKCTHKMLKVSCFFKKYYFYIIIIMAIVAISVSRRKLYFYFRVMVCIHNSPG